MQKIGPVFILIAALLWSLDGLLRQSLFSLPPAVVVFYEHLLGAVLLLFLFPLWGKELRKMSRKEWIGVSVVALFSGALGTMLYTAALGKVQYTQYSVVVLLQQLQPIWAIVSAGVFLKEKITKRFLLWAGIALVSAYFISFRDLHVNFSTGNQTLIAALLAVGAGIAWGSSTALSKLVLNKVSFLTATALRFLLTPVYAFLFILLFNQQQSLSALNSVQWQTLFGITFSTGLLALAIYYFGLKKTPARVATICELIWPASALFIDYFYFHKVLSLTQIIGIAILLLAIYNVSKEKK